MRQFAYCQRIGYRVEIVTVKIVGIEHTRSINMMNKIRKAFLIVLIALVASIRLSGCSHKSEQPAQEQPSSEQPTEEQPSSEQPAQEHPSNEHPSSEHPTGEHPK
jgi:hypothetical protein